jgi:hypothetical protein
MADPWRTLPAMRFDGRDGPRFVFRAAGGGPERVVITVVESDVVRVQVQPLGRARVGRTWAVVGRAGDVGPEGRDREDLSVFGCPEPAVEREGDLLRLRTDRFTLEVTPRRSRCAGRCRAASRCSPTTPSSATASPATAAAASATRCGATRTRSCWAWARRAARSTATTGATGCAPATRSGTTPSTPTRSTSTCRWS